MAQYQKQVSLGGDWVKSADLKTGMRAKIISETNPMPSQFQNKDGTVKNQDVCKVKFEGFNQVFNVALNRATINGLVDSFGEDSKNWMNQVLAVETEKMRVAGRAVVALYLIPDGFKRIDDQNGYAMIVRNEVDPREMETQPSGHVEQQDDPRDKNLPF